MCIYTYTYTHIHIHIYTHLHVWCIHIFIYTHMYTYICTHTCIIYAMDPLHPPPSRCIIRGTQLHTRNMNTFNNMVSCLVLSYCNLYTYDFSRGNILPTRDRHLRIIVDLRWCFPTKLQRCVPNDCHLSSGSSLELSNGSSAAVSNGIPLLWYLVCNSLPWVWHARRRALVFAQNLRQSSKRVPYTLSRMFARCVLSVRKRVSMRRHMLYLHMDDFQLGSFLMGLVSDWAQFWSHSFLTNLRIRNGKR